MARSRTTGWPEFPLPPSLRSSRTWRVFGIPWTTVTAGSIPWSLVFPGASKMSVNRGTTCQRIVYPLGTGSLPKPRNQFSGAILTRPDFERKGWSLLPSPSGPVRPPATENVQIFESAPTEVTVSVQGSINRGASWSTRVKASGDQGGGTGRVIAEASGNSDGFLPSIRIAIRARAEFAGGLASAIRSTRFPSNSSLSTPSFQLGSLPAPSSTVLTRSRQDESPSSGR